MVGPGNTTAERIGNRAFDVEIAGTCIATVLVFDHLIDDVGPLLTCSAGCKLTLR